MKKLVEIECFSKSLPLILEDLSADVKMLVYGADKAGFLTF